MNTALLFEHFYPEWAFLPIRLSKCRWTIEDFRTKMETFKLGQQLESSQFVINGLKLCINLYPNGRYDLVF